jgi:chaperone modulatory protein CbpM
MRIDAVLALFSDLDEAELHLWIERRWVRPEPAEAGSWSFQEIDIARVRLVYDLSRSCDVGAEMLPLVLSLVDQVYGLRADLKALTSAIDAQPEPVRAAILAAALAA